ncbi:ComEC/Rec2 family competence protein [Nocardia otitidiscaviarum]|uniref:ComEC/Rec2 family competence protein n=1 Tax=Nocardia otitidiscaviarum TaxID=1823 RepID=UPI001894254A|nr:ComEC/Rec2 family competence protein [Nocardia otitidiscaviarum]MBF6133006.1 ComEC/Rec2 family competence protein [Nocardia otitidiscaviarum]
MEPEQVVDARLVGPALCCWAATIVGVAAGWRVGVVLAAVLLGVAVVLWVRVARGVRCGRRGLSAALATVLIGAGFAGAAAWHDGRTAAHPLRELDRGAHVWVTAIPVDDPKALSAKAVRGKQWLVRARLVEYRYGADTVRVGGRVLVLAHGDAWTRLLPGQRVTFRAKVYPPWRSDLTVAVLRAQGPPAGVGPPPGWQRIAGAVRVDFAESAARALSPDAAGLLPGLVIGDTSRLPDHVRTNFRETHLTHLTAVSGANVTILLGAVLLSLRALTVDPRVAAVVAGAALVMFVILARPTPSVLRAAVMGAVALLALCTGRRKQALPALCTAAIGLLAWSPELAVDAGFALSVLATAGLVLLAPGWSEWLQAHRCWRAPADALAVSAAAFVVTTPVIIGLTGHLNPLAIAVNVLVAPVVAPITVLGALGAVFASLWNPLAQLVLYGTAPPLWWLLTASEHAAALGTSITVPAGTGSGLVAAGLCVLIYIVGRRIARAR